MNRRKNWALWVTIAVAGALMSAAVACSSSSDNGGGNATATAAIGATPTEAGQTPSETLTESAIQIEMTEFKIRGADGGEITSPTAGNVTFEVHNDGTIVHEFVIIKTDTDAGSQPMSSTTVDEAAAGSRVDKIKDLPAGEIKVLSVDLQPGKYALICNIAGHYQQGMYAQLVVQ